HVIATAELWTAANEEPFLQVRGDDWGNGAGGRSLPFISPEALRHPLQHQRWFCTELCQEPFAPRVVPLDGTDAITRHRPRFKHRARRILIERINALEYQGECFHATRIAACARMLDAGGEHMLQ